MTVISKLDPSWWLMVTLSISAKPSVMIAMPCMRVFTTLGSTLVADTRFDAIQIYFGGCFMRMLGNNGNDSTFLGNSKATDGVVKHMMPIITKQKRNDEVIKNIIIFTLAINISSRNNSKNRTGIMLSLPEKSRVIW
ncbi:unnamed protein product [Absidia cylindrospora]